MYICNYCGRVLKKEYEVCPGCGGSSFETKAELGETVIETPPQGGYKLNINNYNESLKRVKRMIAIGLFLTFMPVIIPAIVLLFILIYAISNTDILLSAIPFLGQLWFISLLGGAAIGIVILVRNLKRKKEYKKAITRIQNLAQKGLLVKNIPYEITNNRIKVVFKNSAGIEIPLFSETKYDTEKIDETVDLLIDPNDYSNYFIDYEIF